MSESPVILIVDDEPAALAGMLDALTPRFGGDYRVEPHLSTHTALDSITGLKDSGEKLALVIADQWMQEMTGNEFLGQVRTLVPAAKRALTITRDDLDASAVILQACAMGQMDNYLYKPWAPAEELLCPLVSELLAEWTRLHRPGMALIRLVGDDFSTRANEIRELLECSGVLCALHAAGSLSATQLVEAHDAWQHERPLLVLPNGSLLINPDDDEIMDAINDYPGMRHRDVMAELGEHCGPGIAP